MTFYTWMNSVCSQVEQRIATLLPIGPTELVEAMQYAVLGGGKRLRTLLCVAASELRLPKESIPVDQAYLEEEQEEYFKDALSISSAIEMIHAYSLIHDDLPCMDDDDLRRGKPSCHKKFGEAIALLAGDALLTHAFTVLSQTPMNIDCSTRMRMIAELSSAAGAQGMVGGQILDVISTGNTISRSQLETMHFGKTGALIRASLLLGFWLRNSQNVLKNKLFFNTEDGLTCVENNPLLPFSQSLGILYQVVDDILDVTSTTQQLGKTAGKDEEQDKPTYVKLLGLEGAKEEAQRLANEAIDKLSPYGESANRLRELIRTIVSRSS